MDRDGKETIPEIAEDVKLLRMLEDPSCVFWNRWDEVNITNISLQVFNRDTSRNTVFPSYHCFEYRILYGDLRKWNNWIWVQVGNFISSPRGGPYLSSLPLNSG